MTDKEFYGKFKYLCRLLKPPKKERNMTLKEYRILRKKYEETIPLFYRADVRNGAAFPGL